MNDELNNYWVLDKKSETSAVFICLIEDRVKELFIEWFGLEVEFIQAETKTIDGRICYRVNVDDPDKIIRLNNFCIATDKKSNLN